MSFAPERVKNSKWRGIEGAAEFLTSGGPEVGVPIFGWGEVCPGGPIFPKLGVSKYRTIWLKTAVFPIWPRAKMGDFHPRKKAFFDPQKTPQFPPALSWLKGRVSSPRSRKKIA